MSYRNSYGTISGCEAHNRVNCERCGVTYAPFPTWQAVRAHVDANRPIWYQAPMDHRPHAVIARTYQNGKIRVTPGSPDVDPFTADDGHLDRFRFRQSMKLGTVEPTEWEVWIYDVWGNVAEGYEVNDQSCLHREYPIECPITRYNVDSDRAFDSATPTDDQIREIFGITGSIDTDGDDLVIYVNDENGRPIGEMRCISHESLSPIRRGQPARK